MKSVSKWFKKNRLWLFIVGGAVLAGFTSWLMFGVFAVHLLFVDDVVDEDLPDFFAFDSETSDESNSFTSTNSDMVTRDETSDEAVIMGLPTTTSLAVPANPGIPNTGSVPNVDSTPSNTFVDQATVRSTTTVAGNAPFIEASGEFIDRSHPTSGKAVVLGDGSGTRFLRFEDFETDNGPDLDVYLSSAAHDGPADDFDEDFINLGDLKGNKGNQNYEIPAGVNLDLYSTVVIWCVRFAVAFGAANLVAA